MGTYLNPGNSGFEEILQSDYVDKTGLIGLINRTIGKKSKLTCVSRPRRFGKSFAAQMLCAYYDKTCDSGKLFQNLEIAKDATYETHRNKYDVIYVDMTGLKPYTDGFRNIVAYLCEAISAELAAAYPTLTVSRELTTTLVNAAELAGNKFIMIIDEWDAPVRETPETEKEYLEFLRSLFKNSGTTAKIFAAAYMTGILPIKKDGSQSAISDFREISMLKPRQYAQYVGFTGEEVAKLCEQNGVDFAAMKKWYDGYSFPDAPSVYNPNSVIHAIENHDFDSYWTQTSAAEGLMSYISMDYAGMAKTVAELIGGVETSVNPAGFANDLITFKGRDDVLTLLVHLGYLAYEEEKGTVRIPNEEIRLEFQRAIRLVDHEETNRRLKESDQLFYDTIHGNEEAVAAQIEKVHLEETAPLHYNREDSLRSVIKLAYYTYRDHYLQWEELPAGAGYADVVYFPKRGSDYPALVIELKWNQSAGGAIGQILDRRYPEALKNYGGEILLVGINYDRDALPGMRRHTCRIQNLIHGVTE